MAYGLACQDQHLVFLQIGCGSIKSSQIDFLTNLEPTRCTTYTSSLHRADYRLLSCKLSTKIHFRRYHESFGLTLSGYRPGCLSKWKFSCTIFNNFFCSNPEHHKQFSLHQNRYTPKFRPLTGINGHLRTASIH